MHPVISNIRLGALATVVVIAGIAAAVGAPSAGAVTLLTCGGAEIASYSPPLTNTPQSVSATTQSNYQPCVNALNPLEFRTGVAATSLPAAQRACTRLVGSNTGERVIRWSTGSTSTFSFVATTNFVAGGALQVLQQGSITAGEFRGSTALGVVVVASGALGACDTTGVSTLGGIATLTIAL